MPQDDKHPRSDDSLDQAIRRALEVDTDQQRLARLEQYWIQQTQWRRRTRQTIALAAAAVLAFAICGVVWNRQRNTLPPQAAIDSTSVPEAIQPSDPVLISDDKGQSISAVAGRLPTTYERFVFAARTRTQVPTTAPTLRTTIDEAIDKLTRDPDTKVTQVFDALLYRPGDAEALLLGRLSESTDEKLAILQLLSVCGTPQSLPALLLLSQSEALRDEAFVTMERIVGIERLAEVVATSPNHRVRTALMRRLFESESEPAMRGFLSLLRDHTTRSEALTVAKQAPRPPVTALMAFLDHDEPWLRLSAAIVLGHMNGPTVTKSLIGRVMQKPADSTEAWIALLACRGEVAEEFFAYATQRPQLLGYFNNARVRWAQMVP